LAILKEDAMYAIGIAMPRVLAAVVLLANLAMSNRDAFADSWPERMVRIVTGPLAPGSSIDATARILADDLSKRWKQPIVIENRPGADGIIMAQAFLQMNDGHTLMFTTHSVFTVVPLLRATIPYDPKQDFAPISLAVEDFLCIVVAPSLPVSTLSELVDFARKQPGVLNYYAVPGSPYLAYLAFQKNAEINTSFVPYANFVNAMSDLSQGRLQIAVLPLAAVKELAAIGKLKVLAVTNPQRSPTAKEIPTVGEAGFPDFTFGGLLGMFGPKDMAHELRDRIATDMRATLGQPEIKSIIAKIGMAARGTSPDEFSAILDEQRAKWAAIARDNDIRPQ
jgi:tripartite-type tricarboxylate transporter receptor subunit TctC